MTHPAILGRIFDREIINPGFSGNGKMEPEVTRFFAELDPAVFMLDCLPNRNDTEVHEPTAPCVKTLRAVHPETPILLVEDRNFTGNDFNAALREKFAKLQVEEVPHIYYLKAGGLLASDGEGTIDSSHPIDLGFTRQAAEFARVLQQIPTLR